MVIMESEFSLIDPKEKKVTLSFSINKNVLAKINFDFENDKTEIIGDLYNLIGYQDNALDRDKYQKYIQIQKWMAEKLLEKSK